METAIQHALALVFPGSMVVLLLGLASLSKRLGAITARPPVYGVFYVGAALIGLSMCLRILAAEPAGRLAGQDALAYDIPFVLGLLISVVVAWHYWGWLLYEQEQTDL